MEIKQTVVDWLEENLIGNPHFESDFIHNINVFNQAKQMEKESTTEEDIIAKAHSINLPSDEEIADKAYAWCQIPGDDGYINSGDDYDVHELPAFIAGAKWVVSLLNNKTMGWKSTIDITRTQALALVMDYALQCGNLSDSELEDLLQTLGYGDDPKLPYVGHNFNIVKQQDNG